MWVAEGSKRLLTVIINLWCGIYASANTPASLYNGFLQMAQSFTAKIWKTSQKCLVASLVKFFQKATGQILRGVICLCTHGGERSRQAPDELDIPTSVPCVWGR